MVEGKGKLQADSSAVDEGPFEAAVRQELESTIAQARCRKNRPLKFLVQLRATGF